MQRHLLYVDESGFGNLADSRQNLLLTGLIVEEKEDSEISAYFNYIKKIYKIVEGTTFHSYDLFENPKSKLYLTPKKALKLVASLIEFIKIIPIKVSIRYLDKKRLRDFFKMKDGENRYFTGSEEAERWKDIPYEVLASKIFFWFADYVASDKKSRGSIVAESRKESDHALLRSYLRCKTPSQYNSQNMRKCSEKMQRVVSSIRFEGKIGCRPGLEIVDLFSYVAYQSITNKLRTKHFKERNFASLWRAIKSKIDNKKISEANNRTFKTYLFSRRVYKISNKVKMVNNPESLETL